MRQGSSLKPPRSGKLGAGEKETKKSAMLKTKKGTQLVAAMVSGAEEMDI